MSRIPIRVVKDEGEVFEHGFPVMRIEVRLTACACSDPTCEVRAKLTEVVGEGDLGAVTLSVDYAPDLPAVLALASWDAVNGAAGYARTEIAQRMLVERLADGLGGTVEP